MTTDQGDPLQVLIAKWLARADERRNGFHQHSERAIAAMRCCAKELEAVRASLGSSPQPRFRQVREKDTGQLWDVEGGKAGWIELSRSRPASRERRRVRAEFLATGFEDVEAGGSSPHQDTGTAGDAG